MILMVSPSATKTRFQFYTRYGKSGMVYQYMVKKANANDGGITALIRQIG